MSQPPPTPSSTTPDLYTVYQDLFSTHLPTLEKARITLQDPHAPLWQHIVRNLQHADDDALTALLNKVYAQFPAIFPNLPPAATRRPAEKSVDRLRRKLVTVVEHSAERSACADWLACRIEAPFPEFDRVKKELAECLGSDVALVWRTDDVGSLVKRDVVLFGYAFRKGSAAIMEIQILEPVAAWVFEMNSKAKHGGEHGCVTFKESKDFYDAVKRAILDGVSRDALPFRGNVREYYEHVREENGGPQLRYDHLYHFQTLVDEVLDRQ